MTATRDEILHTLKQMSERYPEWRFGQLVANICLWAQGPKAQAIWDVEDDQFLETIKSHLVRQVIER